MQCMRHAQQQQQINIRELKDMKERILATWEGYGIILDLPQSDSLLPSS